MRITLSIILILCISNIYASNSASVAIIKQVQNLKEDQQYNEAFRVIKNAYEANPDDQLLKEEFAILQAWRKATKEAIILFEELSKNNPSNKTYDAKIIELLVSSNKIEEALTKAENFDEKNLSEKDQLTYLKNACEMYKKANHWPKEIIALEKLQKLEPKNEEINFKIGKAYCNMDNYDEGYKFLDKYLESSVNKTPGNLYELGIYYYNGSRFKQAAHLMQLAKNTGYTTSASFYYNLANIYYDAKDFPNALLSLDAAKKISPFDQDVNMLFAYTYMENGQYKEAKSVVDDMLKINPNNAELVYFTGTIFQKGGDKDKAEKYFEKAIKMKPDLERLRVSKMKLL